jgi:LacI family transcriptional regulator
MPATSARVQVETPLRVLIDAADGAYTRQVLAGLLAEAQRWRWLVRWQTAVPIADLRDWRPHGIITDSDRPGWLRQLQGLAAPLLSIGRQVPGIACAIVGNDDRAIGVAAGRHLWEQGFRHFAGAGSLRLWLVRERLAGFAARLELAQGLTHLPSNHDGGSWPRADAALAAALRRLPRPCAVFCADGDRTAWQVALVAQQCGMRLPEDLGVLGVGNDPLACLSSQPALSSVVLPTARIGVQAAAWLAAAMAGQEVRQRIQLPPPGIERRGSTGMAGCGDAAVGQALAWLQEHCRDARVVAAHAAGAVALSARTLERRFRQHLQRTPSAMIEQFRLEHAEELLAGPLDLVSIARQSGFPSRKALAGAVTRARGMTCAERRRQLRQ